MEIILNRERKQSVHRNILWMLVMVVLSACSSLQTPEQKQQDPLSSRLDTVQKAMPGGGVGVSEPVSSDRFTGQRKDQNGDKGTATESTEPVRIFKGTGNFVKAVPPRQAAKTPGKGDVTLNFENTDIREIVKVVLGDLLQVNYILDPRVRGGVSMQTGRPLKREDLLPTLETLLRMNGAAMVETAGTYRIAPAAKVLQGTATPQLAGASTPLPSGYNILIVPLKYISAGEMSKILKPLAVEGSIVRVDQRRNLIVLAGTGRELDNMLDTVHTFDVDWLKGMSVGFFELQYTKAADVQRDLETILSGKGKGDEGLGSLIRVLPIESANGLLVVTQRPEYLDKLSRWIQRMDVLGSQSGGEVRLYVYRVKNGDAEKVADMLNSVYSKKKKATTESASVAPGLIPEEIESPTPDTKTKKAEKRPSATPKSVNNPGFGAATLETEVGIVADTENNSLLIMATARDYEKMLKVLKELDIVPLQVHIEATIVEVKLNDSLRYGIQWALRADHGEKSSRVFLDSDTGEGLSGRIPGFNWTLIDSAERIRAVLTAFADDTEVSVLSAPSVMVLDNHTAEIQVGASVPIATQQQQGTDNTSNIINSIEYRDTGVILSVKPRVNPGGLVTMEIEQEVSDVATTGLSTLNSPTINKRNITSTVAVQSGQAVVLGGLIETTEDKTKGGVPGLYRLPVVGALFGETTNKNERKELVVILTPSVIADSRDAKKITEDFRARLQGLKGSFWPE